MSFAQEMRDFTSAFTAVSNVMGTVSSREGDRLNNELRRANIDYTRARTAEIGGAGLDFGTYVAGLGGYTGSPLDRSVDPGGSGTSAATGALDIGAGSVAAGGKGAGIPWSGDTPTVPSPRIRPTRAAVAASVPTPPPRPTAGAAGAVGDVGPVGATGVRPYEVKIGDHTSWSGMQPKALQIANTMGETARQMGIRLVATAGAGGGHRSHGMGSESDWMGYHISDGSEWNTAERARILASAGSVGANRFGLYPGGSAHVGYSGADRPSAVWGAHGILNGGSARDFSDPADRAFLSLFQSGKLYGAGGGTFAQAFATTGASPLARARNAIAAIESRGSGDYGARNGDGLGRYQVMASNLPSWSQRAIGRVVSPEEFLRNPAIQDRIFDTQFGSLLEKYGNVQDAASAWFTGRPLGGGGAGASDGNITGAEYVKRFNQAYGSADYSSGGGGGADVARGGPRDDTLPEPIPLESVARQSSRDDTSTTSPEDLARPETRGVGVPMGTSHDIIHQVVGGDTLWDLSKRYNLDTYMEIVKANPDIKNPDLIYPGDRVVIPGGAKEVDIPLPRPRGEGAVGPDEVLAGAGGARPEGPAAGVPAAALDVGGARPMPGGPGALPAAAPGGARPMPGGPGGLPAESPVVHESDDNLHAQLDAAYNAIVEVKGANIDPARKKQMMDALTVKIESIKDELQRRSSTGPFAPRPEGEAAGMPRAELDVTPRLRPNVADTQGVRPELPAAGMPAGAVDAGVPDPRLRPGQLSDPLDPIIQLRARNLGRTDQNVVQPPVLGRRGADTTGAVPSDTYPRPMPGEALTPGVTEEPISGTDMSGVGAVDALDRAGGRADTMTPAEASIAEASAAYNVTSYGNMVHPNGYVGADSSFTSGRKAAIAGSGWLARMLGLDKAGAVDDAEAAAPDDGAPTAASAKLSGKFAMSHTEIAQAHQVIDAWAEKNGLAISESERNVRALGLVFDYWLSRGEPEKAQALAAAMLQYHQVLYNQYSAIGKAAVEAGDTEKGVEAAVKAYAQIPDGRDITVTGDAVSGWKVRYTDEETGKVISEKVLSPQEMEGMIMHMSPGDVDKFLVKAAGQDALPEASPQLVKFLADMNATPDGVRPTVDFTAIAGLDSREAQIALEAARQQMSQYDEFTGGAEGRARVADAATLGLTSTGAPATGGAADTGAPTATGAPAGAVDAGVPATAPTTSTPAAATTATPAALAVDGFPAGQLVEGTTDVYYPGTDHNFGMGDRPPADYATWLKLQTSGGAAVAKDQYDNQVRLWQEARGQREYRYQQLISQTGEVPTPKAPVTPALPEARTKDDELSGSSVFDLLKVPGEIVTNIARNAAKAELPSPDAAFLPDTKARLTPDIAPGPLSTLEGYGMLDRPRADKDVLAALSGSPFLEGYKADIAEQQRLWQRLWDTAQQEYKDDTAPPTPRKFTGEDVRGEFDTAFASFRTTHLGAPPAEEGVSTETGPMEEMRNAAASTVGDVTKIFLDHLDRNAEFVKSAAVTIGELNHMTIQGATDITASMIMPNRDKPWTPWFVAVDQPGQPNMKRVQLVHNDGTPDQGSFLVPKDTFEALQQTWQQGRDEWLGNAKYQKVFSLGDVFTPIPGKFVTPAEVQGGALTPTQINRMAEERQQQLERQRREATTTGLQKERNAPPPPPTDRIPIAPAVPEFNDVGPKLGIPHPSIW